MAEVGCPDPAAALDRTESTRKLLSQLAPQISVVHCAPRLDSGSF